MHGPAVFQTRIPSRVRPLPRCMFVGMCVCDFSSHVISQLTTHIHLGKDFFIYLFCLLEQLSLVWILDIDYVIITLKFNFTPQRYCTIINEIINRSSYAKLEYILSSSDIETKKRYESKTKAYDMIETQIFDRELF